VTTPKRRRRVMSTSSSDNERQGPDLHNANQQTPSRSAPTPIALATNNAAQLPSQSAGKKTEAKTTDAADVIELVSSDDSMYILRSEARQAGGGTTVTSPRQAAVKRSTSSKSGQPHHNSKRQRPSRCGASFSKTQKFTGEAEEASTDCDTELDSCAESERDAQDLYHEAIMGVRRANNARNQLRSATINCPVCAKFAAYLQHFTS
jgi:hypothetical protein